MKLLFEKLYDEGFISTEPEKYWTPLATKDYIWENYYIVRSGRIFHLLQGWMINTETFELASPETTKHFDLDFGKTPMTDYMVRVQNRDSDGTEEYFNQIRQKRRLAQEGLLSETPSENDSSMEAKQ